VRTSLTQTHTQKTKTKKTHRASSQNSSLNRKYLHYSRGKACYRLAIQNSIDALFSALFLVVLIHSTGWKAKATAQTRKKVLKEKQAFLSAMVCPDKNWRKQWILNTVLYFMSTTQNLCLWNFTYYKIYNLTVIKWYINRLIKILTQNWRSSS